MVTVAHPVVQDRVSLSLLMFQWHWKPTLASKANGSDDLSDTLVWEVELTFSFTVQVDARVYSNQCSLTHIQKTGPLQSQLHNGVSPFVGHCPFDLWCSGLNWSQLNNAWQNNNNNKNHKPPTSMMISVRFFPGGYIIFLWLWMSLRVCEERRSSVVRRLKGLLWLCLKALWDFPSDLISLPWIP